MLIEPILGYKSTWRILELLFETPRKMVSRMELFKHTLLGNAPLSEGLQRLTTSSILIKEKKGKKESYCLNMGNENVLLLRELWEKERKILHYLDYDTKIIISEFLRQIDFVGIENIWLFGSHAKGTASVRSDIDIAVIFKERVANEIEIMKIVKLMQEKFEKEIQVHYFTLKNFTDKDNVAKEIKREGISLLS